MKKSILFLLCVVLISTFVNAKKLTDLHENLKEPTLFVDKDGFYIFDSDMYRLHIYSKTDYKHKKAFLKQGEGPGEFRFWPIVMVYPDYFYLMEPGKICYFSKDGIFKNEIAIPNNYSKVNKIKGHFVARRKDKSIDPRKEGKIKYVFVILDSNFKEIKTIYEWFVEVSSRFGSQQQDFFVYPHYRGYRIYDDKIIICDTAKGFYFAVCNDMGEKLYEINKKYNKFFITKEKQKEYTKAAKAKMGKKWEIFEQRFRVVYPEHFPAFKGFRIFDGKIYVHTYKKKNNINTIILDLKGNIIKETRAPGNISSYVYDNNFYYIVENDEEEVWELHVDKII